jgi:hypothetical protein
MKTSSLASLVVLISGFGAMFACSAQQEDSRPNRSGSTGDAGSGGTGFAGTGVAGTYSSAGTYSTAGTYNTAGTYGAGGTGTAGTYGTAGTGTAGTGVAGTFSAGGTGTAGTGTAGTGTAGTGTAGTGTAGSGAAGGGAVTCDTKFALGTDGFVRAPGAGGECWHGYASAGCDSGSMCAPKTYASCAAPCMLNFSGMVGPANAGNSYAGVAYIGFNINQATGTSTSTPMKVSGSGLNVNYTSTGPAVRIQISSGTSAATRWCANLTGSATIPYAMFNTKCFDTPADGVAFMPGTDMIDQVQIIVPGGAALAPFSVTITSIADM